MIPLYKMIYKNIKKQIDDGILKVGDLIMSESQLRMKYKCSRDTVRKATSLLENNNYIEKTRGKQARVKERNIYTFPTSKIETLKELSKKNNLKVKTKLISINYDVKDKEEFTKYFSKNVEVKRVRNIDGEDVVIDIDYFDANLIKGLNKKICEDSIYKFIETNLGVEIGYSKKIVTVQKPTSEDMKLLGIDEDYLLVNVMSATFTKDNYIFQTTISKHKHDKFRFEAYAER
ncbi:UTRA domain-containing protein [Helcococcus ovis]|uniref:UTRA domain-containing protein n=1 Tax=Helcococcus ovis TaxID=72026 RepID=UPI001070344C|nr:UTRA domain-containing protein [Helcococcus ovis]TFF68765.1 UTRA domain-containing protein [Helcococcus ovis]WNZ01217.1 UTRA domain-containing protein [Helcococcus ovis]